LARMGKRQIHIGFWWESLTEGDHLVLVGVDRGWVLKKYKGTLYNPFLFILVINQFMYKICFTLSLFHASTCFEHHVLIGRRSKLYYRASGIITQV